MAMEIFTVGRGQEGYPERLMPFADMPSRLFVRGALPADEQKTAAIVGARICTAYGKSQAAFFAQVLADVVLVIEAKEKSGSLITADYALEQGKTVFALPGRTTDATSRGCNRLIAQGAEIAISPETILEELGVKKAGTKRAAPRPRYGKEAEMVLKTLAAEPQNLAQLAGSTGIPLQELTGILLALEIDGVIAENPPGVYMALL